jgi:hypothetical protein
MTDDNFELVLPFVDQSSSFAHGFECGQLYQQMTDGKSIEGEQISEESREQVEKICKRFLYQYDIGISVNGWCSFNAHPVGQQN